MNYINIISKEDVVRVPASVGWITITILLAILLIPIIIHYIIVRIKHEQLVKVVYTEMIAGALALVLCVVSSITILPKFAEPTGKYNYKVTVDKDKITVSQYEDFIEKYKPEIKDGYYYFEYGEIE